jgi:von Willebrand factor type A domain-containing protein
MIGGDPPPSGNPPGDPGPDANCPAVHFTASQVNPSVQLLIDRSGSMSTDLAGTSTSRYQAMHDALVGTGGVVATLQGKAYFGASLFSSDNPCPMLYKSQPRQMMNLTSIKSLIESQGPNGNTPTPPAIDQTVADFVAHPAPQGSPPVIVLATDGLPNSCTDGSDTTPQTVVAAKAAYAAGVRLFVLGIAGVNDTFLQSVANAGVGVQSGQPNAAYYTANSPQQLKDAFNAIIGGVLSCDLALNGTIDPDQAMGGTVTLNGQTLTYGTDWKVVNGSTLELLGAACDTLKNSAMPQVDASFSCGATLF